MAVPTQVKLTYDDLRLFPDDGKPHELIAGDHILTPAPKISHQNASGNLFEILRVFVRKNKLGRVFAAPVDVVLSQYDVIEPDFVFISREREKTITEDNVRGAPDLVVEILSPSSAELDRKTKLRLYEQYGVREYWLISTEAENIQVLVLHGGKFELLGNFTGSQAVHSEVLSGFTCNASQVFEM
jgi:Uma2 family endonuclease